MKKAKIILSMILIIIFVFMSNITSFAYAEQYAHPAPDGIAGQWIEDDLKVDMSVSSSPAYPDMVFFRYKPSTLRSLPTTFASNDNREIYIYLMEDDIGNNDDYVKYYTGSFYGRTINKIEYKYACTSASIEATYGVELYIKQNVSTATGDASTAYTSLFSFYYETDAHY